MALIPILLGYAAAALGPDDFTIMIPVSPETLEGQRLVAARAREICGSRFPLPSRYSFSGREMISPEGVRQSVFEVSQELTCSDRPPDAAAAEPPAPADWRASDQDDTDVRAATMGYFAAVDAGDAARVHAMWIEAERAARPLEARVEALRRFRSLAGAPGAHRIVRLTWYVNPQGAPRPGIYVAADYERAYAGLHFNCGYLIWFREAAGRYALTREETSSFHRGDSSATPGNIAEARHIGRCEPG
ncbi:MAG TPA: hypothetical protein VEW71_05160 [Allosphingosinicella sp.]|nr:hypothetical protein [Allosphingosinicella sp.]